MADTNSYHRVRATHSADHRVPWHPSVPEPPKYSCASLVFIQFLFNASYYCNLCVLLPDLPPTRVTGLTSRFGFTPIFPWPNQPKFYLPLSSCLGPVLCFFSPPLTPACTVPPTLQLLAAPLLIITLSPSPSVRP